MKASPELRADINKAMSYGRDNTDPKLLACAGSMTEPQSTRLRWLMFWDGIRHYPDADIINRAYYGENLNDNHIDTVLRRFMRDNSYI